MSYPTNSLTFVTVAPVFDSRRDDESMGLIGEEKLQESRGRPAVTQRAEGILADLFVARRR